MTQLMTHVYKYTVMLMFTYMYMCVPTCSEFTVKHCFSPDKELVSDSLSQTESILQRGAVYGSDEWLTQWQLVDL